MARHILIVDESDMMRRVLQARILTSLDDAVISEAVDVKQAASILAKSPVHLILYGWDIQDEVGLQFCRRAAAGQEGTATPYLLLISDKKEHIDMAIELAGRNFLVMPCPAEDLAKAINRLCNPMNLRQTARYSIQDTRALIEQRQVRVEASVMNVSAGGALCEFELDGQLSVAYPYRMSIEFGGESEPVTVGEIQAVVSNMLVLTRHADQTPKRVRMGVKFVQLAGPALETIVRVLQHSQHK